MNLLLLVISFIFMECLAWFSHKYIMHGLLWKLHKDHHVPSAGEHFFEKNDSFFVIFALPAMVLFIIAGVYKMPYLNWVATGISLYGAAYFVIHDVFIHQRFGWLKHTKSKYLIAIRRAHKMHHKHLSKEKGECFGMLWVPLKYYKK